MTVAIMALVMHRGGMLEPLPMIREWVTG